MGVREGGVERCKWQEGGRERWREGRGRGVVEGGEGRGRGRKEEGGEGRGRGGVEGEGGERREGGRCRVVRRALKENSD